MKYPDDFKGWLPLGMMFNGRYLIIEKPDHKYQAWIHVADNELVELLEAKTGEKVYSHPRNLKTARALLAMIQIDNWMYQSYQKL